MPIRLPADKSVAIPELHIADRLPATEPAGLIVETELAKEVWNVAVEELIPALVEGLHVLRIGLAAFESCAGLEHRILYDGLNGDHLLRVNGAGHEGFRRGNSKHEDIRVVVAQEFLFELLQARLHQLRQRIGDELEVGLATIGNGVAVHVDVKRPRLRGVRHWWPSIWFDAKRSLDFVPVSIHNIAVIKFIESLLNDGRENSSILVTIAEVVRIFVFIAEHGGKGVVIIVAPDVMEIILAEVPAYGLRIRRIGGEAAGDEGPAGRPPKRPRLHAEGLHEHFEPVLPMAEWAIVGFVAAPAIFRVEPKTAPRQPVCIFGPRMVKGEF